MDDARRAVVVRPVDHRGVVPPDQLVLMHRLDIGHVRQRCFDSLVRCGVNDHRFFLSHVAPRVAVTDAELTLARGREQVLAQIATRVRNTAVRAASADARASALPRQNRRLISWTTLSDSPVAVRGVGGRGHWSATPEGARMPEYLIYFNQQW